MNALDGIDGGTIEPQHTVKMFHGQFLYTFTPNYFYRRNVNTSQSQVFKNGYIRLPDPFTGTPLIKQSL